MINSCSILYVISEIQKKEYEKIFKPPCKILTKMYDFTKEPPQYLLNTKTEIKMVYAGNLGNGRWKSLSLLSKKLLKLNKDLNRKICVDIFSPTPLTKHQIKKTQNNFVKIHNAISYEKLILIQKNSDVLLHIEGLTRRSKNEVRHSLSTKLVDYFYFAKPIFAIGKEGTASIDHLIKNDSAIVATTKNQIYEKVKLVLNSSILSEYSYKAWKCGYLNHNKKTMQSMLIHDMESIKNESCSY